MSLSMSLLHGLNKDMLITMIETIQYDHAIDLNKYKQKCDELQKICDAYKNITRDFVSFDKCEYCDKWVIEDIHDGYENRLLTGSSLQDEIELTDDNYKEYCKHIIHPCQGCPSLICYDHAVYHSVDPGFPQHENFYCIACINKINKN